MPAKDESCKAFASSSKHQWPVFITRNGSVKPRVYTAWISWVKMLVLLSLPQTSIQIFMGKNEVLSCISFGQVGKQIAAHSWCCTMPAFFFHIAFPPHENSSLPRQLNWTKVIYVGCAERKGFVRFQGGHGTLRVRNSLAETWGITVLSLNLHAYDQTWPHFAFAAWLPNLWSCRLETKGSKSNQWASFNGNQRSWWCILLWLIVWMWQMRKADHARFCLHVEV